MLYTIENQNIYCSFLKRLEDGIILVKCINLKKLDSPSNNIRFNKLYKHSHQNSRYGLICKLKILRVSKTELI